MKKGGANGTTRASKGMLNIGDYDEEIGKGKGKGNDTKYLECHVSPY